VSATNAGLGASYALDDSGRSTALIQIVNRSSGQIDSSVQGANSTATAYGIIGGFIDLDNAGRVTATNAGRRGRSIALSTSGNSAALSRILNRSSGQIDSSVQGANSTALASGISGNFIDVDNAGRVSAINDGLGQVRTISVAGDALTHARIINRAGGIISAQSTNAASTEFVFGVFDNGFSDIDNSGVIQAQAVGTGFSRGLYISTGSTFINHQGGIVSAQSAGNQGLGIALARGIGTEITIDNQGVIRGDQGAIFEGPFAVALTSGQRVTITNSGTLIGDVRLRASDDSLTLSHGSIFNVTSTGVAATADGGAGTNRLILQNAAGEQDASGANFSAWDISSTGNGVWSLSGTLADGGNGARALTQTGAGTLTLTGGNTYSGGTTISAGTLVADSDTALGTGDVANSATLRIGNASVRHLNVGGNFTSIGTLQVAITATPSANANLHVIGSSTLAGTLQIVPLGQASAYRLNDQWTVLHANGGITGDFASVGSSSAFLHFSELPIANNDVIVQLDSILGSGGGLSLVPPTTTFGGIGATANQRNVGGALDRIAPGGAVAAGDPDGQRVVNALLFQSAPEARRSFGQISGAWHADVITLTRHATQDFVSALGKRASLSPGGLSSGLARGEDALADFSGPTLVRGAGNQALFTPSAADGAALDHAWFKAYGTFGRIDSDKNAEGADDNNAGLAFGADHDLTDKVRLGVALGYTHSDADSPNGHDHAIINSYDVGIYGRYELPLDFYLAAQTGFAYHHIDTRRLLEFSNIRRTARAEEDNYSALGGVELGRTFVLAGLDPAVSGPEAKTLGSSGAPAEASRTGIFVMPHVGLDYNHQFRQNFRERGAQFLDLAVDGRDDDSLRVRAGIDLGATLRAGNWNIAPSLDLSYAYETLDSSETVTARLNDPAAQRFQVFGPCLARHYALVDAGLTAQPFGTQWFGMRPSFDLSYGGEYSGDVAIEEVTLGFRLTW
jgi:autotransporter-associated beta strand protein